MGKSERCYAGMLVDEWQLEKHSRKLASCARRVLTELSAESLLMLRHQAKLQLSLSYGRSNIWAYFPAYQRRFRKIQLRPETRVLLTVSVPKDEVRRWPTKEVTDLLRHHLAHTLLYLRSPKAKNDCDEAEREWKECCC